ncbi:GNAT family N-acetyltransferase [Stenotrophomonas geniculata]|uniref:GNAT family N-acetyltransferase n=1 Tax=Stenotrophomonas geniculata TaxID=86188 RepID=UPI0007100380|nr:N-acetyltransferase [Stenotrophomonas geniculata]KRG42269.1 GCN5 family acetyltransferase [Stenotrophomonas geniculata ATCC 19374 = JCM 13324]MBH1851110.1 N-acetyltransferase [Stenotrophomonas maltophilia]CAH0065036.1 Acetyltransferase [Stenotrophomonas maltophilia]HCL45195.1 N-acetyltransferase [Pseudomonas sp.]
MNYTIRAEAIDDHAILHALTEAAFRDAAHSSHTEQFIVDALRARGELSVSLVAEMDGKVIGHVAVSPVTISDGSTGWFGLGPISVLPAWQGQGIGAALMHAALEALRQKGAHGCVLLGEPAYYGRFGFRAEPGLVLPGVPAEYFQALCLQPPLAQGEVQYSPAFEATA